jgi:hypothetical protein
LVWKWSRSKIPSGLKEIIKEKNDRFRGRRFHKVKNANRDSINFRIAVKAEKYIATLSQIKTRKRATNVLQEDLLSTKYSFVCTNRMNSSNECINDLISSNDISRKSHLLDGNTNHRHRGTFVKALNCAYVPSIFYHVVLPIINIVFMNFLIKNKMSEWKNQ